MRLENKHIMTVRACLALVAAIALSAGTAWADLPNPHVFLDYMNLGFSYTLDPGPDGKVGTFSITDIVIVLPGEDSFSSMTAKLRDGSGNPIASAAIGHADNFNVSLSGDVIKKAANDYVLQGTLAGTDVDTGSNAILASFESTHVSLTEMVAAGYWFSVAGVIHTAEGEDAIPINRESAGADTWTFEGDSDDIALVKGVHNFDTGDVVEFHLGVDLPVGATKDTFFSDYQSFSGGDMKVTIIPAPAAVVLGLLGLGLLGLRLRRYA